MENVITEIKWQKRKKDRASVYIDGEFAFGVPAIVIAELRLKVGQAVDAESMTEIVAQAERDGAWNDALKYVCRSVRSVREIKDYLARKEYEPSAIAYAVEKLLGTLRIAALDDGTVFVYSEAFEKNTKVRTANAHPFERPQILCLIVICNVGEHNDKIAITEGHIFLLSV